MKKSYVSPLVSEIEMSVCQSPTGANLAFEDRFYDNVVSEED